MGLSRERAEAALVGCMALSDFRRGALRGFLSALSDDELIAMRIGDSASNEEIAGFLDREEKRSGDMISWLGLVAHATDDSYPLLDKLGFKTGSNALIPSVTSIGTGVGVGAPGENSRLFIHAPVSLLLEARVDGFHADIMS